LAQGAQPNPANPNVLSDISCNGEGTSKELKALATLVVSGEITEEVRRCSQALSDEGKAQLFEIIFVTPVPVNNPDGLRTFSQDTLVSAMLSWYQFWYGGVNGFGITGYNFVKICLGDGGVAAGGGPDHVAYWLKLLQP